MSIRLRVAVLVLRDDHVLMVRHRKPGREYWLIPGGGVEPGETIEEAARREMREETGLEIEVGRLVLVCEAIDPEGSRHVVNMYFTGRVNGGALVRGDEEVLAGLEYRPVDELASLETYPPVGPDLQDLIRTGFAGGVRFLGNTWRPQPPQA